MNKPLFALGVVLAAAGAAAYLLLSQLQMETFRVDLPPWFYVSYGFVIIGASVTFAGLVTSSPTSERIESETAARHFGTLALVNAVAAALFVSPLLIPAFEFPILITRWPGIYMVIAYISFLIVGVLGVFGWSVILHKASGISVGSTIYKRPFLVQLLGTEIGIYGLSIFMFLGGYVGASQDYSGFGPAIVGADMEFSVIPVAASIFLVTAATLLGVLNIKMSKRGESQ